MMIFDLLFLVVLLTTVLALGRSIIALLRGQQTQTRQVLTHAGLGLTLYLVVLIAVSLTTPQRVLALGDDRCFDDWCVAVEAVDQARVLGPDGQRLQAVGVFHIVTLRLSNQGRGRVQRASSAAIHLIDSHGRTYDLAPRGQAAYEAQHSVQAPLTVVVPVGEAVHIVEVFDLPVEAGPLGLTVEHPVGLSPGLLIIGNDASLWHKPTIVRLP
jgi:hypothetical protein